MPTSQTIGDLQLDDFVDVIPRIYSNKDQFRSLWDAWLHLMHHGSAVGEEVRKGASSPQFFTEIADFSMWFFTVISKMTGRIGVPNTDNEATLDSLIRIRHNFSDILWLKYPGMCPVCYWRRSHGERDKEKEPGFDSPCDCMLYEVEARDQTAKKVHTHALRAFATERIKNKPVGVDQWQQMFATIFAANLRHLSFESIAFHLLEEIGEIADAMARTYTYRSDEFVPGAPNWAQVWLEEEISDVSSWLFALVNRADSVRQVADKYDRWSSPHGEGGERPPLRLAQIIWRRYGSNELEDFYCPTCLKQAECECPLIMVPATTSVDKLMGLISDDPTA